MFNAPLEEILLDGCLGLNIARQESEGDRRVIEREITTHYVGNLRQTEREGDSFRDIQTKRKRIMKVAQVFRWLNFCNDFWEI